MNGVSLYPKTFSSHRLHQGFASIKQFQPVDLCYYVAFGIYCFFHLLERTNFVSICGVSFDLVGKISTALMLILVCARLLTVRFQLDSLVWSALILVTSLLVFIVAHSWICLSLALFIVAGKDIDVRPMVLVVLLSTIAVVVITFIGVYSGAISNIASRRPGEVKVRNSLGFNQVNALGAAVARIVTAVVFLRWNKSPILVAGTAAIAIVFLETVANSRTSELYLLLLAVAQCVYYFRLNANRNNTRKVCFACLMLIWGSVLLSFVFLFLFNPSSSLMLTFSKLLSNRLYSAWYLFRAYGVHLFGNGNMVLGGNVWAIDSYATLTIDNAWDQWLVMYGIVPTAILLLGVTSLYFHAIKTDCFDNALIVFALLISIYAFGESTALAVDYNPFLILLCIPLFSTHKSRHNSKANLTTERA